MRDGFLFLKNVILIFLVRVSGFWKFKGMHTLCESFFSILISLRTNPVENFPFSWRNVYHAVFFLYDELSLIKRSSGSTFSSSRGKYIARFKLGVSVTTGPFKWVITQPSFHFFLQKRWMDSYKNVTEVSGNDAIFDSVKLNFIYMSQSNQWNESLSLFET